MALDNKIVLMFMNDEMRGRVISDFVARRPKLHSFKIDKKEKIIVKGVVDSALSYLTFDDLHKTLCENFQLFTF